MNFPFPPGAGNAEYCFAMREAILPLLGEFDPDLVLVSAGFDAHHDDLLGSMRLDEDGYAALTRLLADASRETCNGRLAFVLEGGYNVDAQARSVAALVQTMRGRETEIPDDQPSERHRDVVDRTRSQLREWWKGIF